MAQHYSRAPSSKSRAPVDEWPQHRGGPYPPGQAVGPGAVGMSDRGVPMPERGMERGVPIERGVVGGGGMERGIVAPGMGPGTRLNEVLDAVRSQFDGVLHDNAALMKEREDFETQAAKQINELTSIKNAVQELESVHQKARQQYEDELARLRAEIQTLRAQVANPPGGSGLQLTTNQPGYGERGRDSDMYEREAQAKRLKGPRDEREPIIRTPHQANPDLPPAANGGANDEFPGSLSPSSLPANLRKEGTDWFAMYNPKIPKVLDISLLHQFNHESVVCCVRFSKDGRFLATGCNRTAQIFDMRTGGMVCQLNDENAVSEGDLYIRSVCFSPDGKYLATGAEDRQIRIWDIGKKRIRRLFEGHEQEIYSLDFSSDGNLIVSGSGDKTARIWNMTTGTSTTLSINDPTPGTDGDTPMQDSSVGSDAGVTSVAISPDGRLVAAGSLDTIVRLWDVATGQLLERLRGHKDSVYSVAFTPDGRGLVSGSLDKTLKYWELNTAALRALADNPPVKGERTESGKYAKCTFNFIGHKDYVLSVAISHDGQWVVSGSKDRGVQFWDKNGAPQLMLQGHKNSVISIDLSPTGGQLATGSGDWQARVWSYTTGPSP